MTRERKRNAHHDRRAAACLRLADDARSHRGAGAAADRRAGRGQGLRRGAQSRPRGEQFLRLADARQQDDAAAAGDLRARSDRRRRQGRRAGVFDPPGRPRLCQSGALVRLVQDVPQRQGARLPELYPARLFRPLAGHHARLSLRRAGAIHHRAGDRAGEASRQYELRSRRAARLFRHRLFGDEEDRRRSRPDAADQRRQRATRTQRRAARAGDGRDKNPRHRPQSGAARSRQGAGAGADRSSVGAECAGAGRRPDKSRSARRLGEDS